MTNSEQALRERAINIFADIFTAGGEAHEVGGQSFDQLQQSGYIDRKITDLTALISEHYYPKEKYDELLQQRDELREALISLMWQFAYYGTKNNVAVMHTGGLSALEDAFSALGLSDPITVENFEAAIKNTER